MNEKIKELMEQASYGACYDTDLLLLTGTEIEKFAELIVRECIKQNKSYMINSTHRDFYLGWNDSITHCNESVKEYFGIEE